MGMCSPEKYHLEMIIIIHSVCMHGQTAQWQVKSWACVLSTYFHSSMILSKHSHVTTGLCIWVTYKIKFAVKKYKDVGKYLLQGFKKQMFK